MGHNNQASRNRKISEKGLKEISKSWNAAAWESYLSNTIDHPLKEQIADKDGSFEQVDNSIRELYQEMLARQSFPNLQQLIALLTIELSKRENSVIYEIFWEGGTLREVAQKHNITISSVVSHRNRALVKMGKLLFKNIASKDQRMTGLRQVYDRGTTGSQTESHR